MENGYMYPAKSLCCGKIFHHFCTLDVEEFSQQKIGLRCPPDEGGRLVSGVKKKKQFEPPLRQFPG